MSLSEFDTRFHLKSDIKTGVNKSQHTPKYFVYLVDNEIVRNLPKRFRILTNIDYTFGRIFFRHA